MCIHNGVRIRVKLEIHLLELATTMYAQKNRKPTECMHKIKYTKQSTWKKMFQHLFDAALNRSNGAQFACNRSQNSEID